MSISEEWLEKDETDAEFHVSKAQCYGDSLQTSNVSELITVGNFESADKIYLNVPYWICSIGDIIKQRRQQKEITNINLLCHA